MPGIGLQYRLHPLKVRKMTTQSSLRSNASLCHSPVAKSQFQNGDHVCDNSSLANVPTAATPTRTGARKRRKPAPKSEGDPALPSMKRARMQTHKPQQESSSKPSDDGLQPPSHPSYDEVDVSLDRPAEPHRTNAPLITPTGSRLVTYSKGHVSASPSKTGVPRPTTKASQILDEACAHLIRMEPLLQPLIEKHYCRVFCPEGLAEECDPFKSLCSSIMAQQVSGAAASSIKKKFIGLFRGPLDEKKVKESMAFPAPAQVAACELTFLRQAGLSNRKAEYIKGLAQKFMSGELSAAMLINASDEEVLERLTAVRGLGKWSVEMFACFGLKRTDILSTGDLGVQYVHSIARSIGRYADSSRRGMAAFMGKDVKRLKAKGGGKVSNLFRV